MLGSSQSISDPNVVLNTIVADVLSEFADELEQADDFTTALNRLIRRVYQENRQIIFNGNNYSDEWVNEAEKRGLLNLLTTADAIPHFESRKNISLFTRHGVFSESEITSRTEILLDHYCKVLHIEGLTMLEMARQDILPAVIRFSKEVTDTALAKKQLGIMPKTEEQLAVRLSCLLDEFSDNIEQLDQRMLRTEHFDDVKQKAKYYKDTVCTAMETLRKTADELEMICGKNDWPYPTYSELLFAI